MGSGMAHAEMQVVLSIYQYKKEMPVQDGHDNAIASVYAAPGTPELVRGRL